MTRMSSTHAFLAAILTTSLLVTQSAAHFFLNEPPTIGFDDKSENVAPCGSFSVDFSTDNVTDFFVGGNSIAVTSIHPQATWLFRATLDTTASGNWTSLLPAILQTGLGNYCEKAVTVPESWAGSKGVLGVVQDAPDGILYQCAAVNFVAGIQASISSVCNNVTGLSASFTTDAALSSLPSSTASATTSTSSGTSTSKPKSAGSRAAPISSSVLGSFVWLGVIGSVTLLIYVS